MREIVQIYDRPTREGLVANVVIAFVFFCGINAAVFGFHLTTFNDSINPSWAPPTWFIGIVWPILFLLTAFARWMLNGSMDEKARLLKSSLVAIFLIDVTHPIYTDGFRWYGMALLGTIVPFALCVYFVMASWNVRRLASSLMIPMCAWFVYAGAIILAVLLRKP
jgi:tryptophan-rich sensory protein